MKGFDPLTGDLTNLGGLNEQVPTLVSGQGKPAGIYYVDNNSNFDVLYLSNSTVHTVAHVVVLYQTYPSYNEMLDNEFFVESGYDEVLFFGTTTSNAPHYSVELVNLTTGDVRIWNTSAPVDASNQQPEYVGNHTVLVMSSNCSIEAFNLVAHTSWNAGTLGFGSGYCFEANNVYWFPQRQQLINVEAQGDNGDHVEQLNASHNAKGQIHFTSAATIAVDSGVVFNWVNGLAYNNSSARIAFTAGYWVSSTVYTYSIRYGSNGLLTTNGLVRYTVENSTTSTEQMLTIQRYVYTSNFVIGRSYGPGMPTNTSQYPFDPWNGTTIPTNRSLDNYVPCGNSCFEGMYDSSPDYLLDYNATLLLNRPMYKVVYAYHLPSQPYPVTTPQLTLTPSRGPNGTIVTLSGSGFPPSSQYTYCYQASAAGCSSGRTFTADSFGNIPARLNLTVTDNASGDVDISENGTLVASAPFQVTVANLSLSRNSGPDRMPVTLSGAGYAPDTSYTYCFNLSATACASGATFTADGSGRIPNGSVTLNVPASAPPGP